MQEATTESPADLAAERNTKQWRKRSGFKLTQTASSETNTSTVADKRELHIILALKLTLTGVLIAITVAFGTLMFILLRQGETLLFQSEYNAVPTQIAASVVGNMAHISSIAALTTKLYQTTTGGCAGGVWPNVTIPGFEGIMGDVLSMTNFRAVEVAPLLNGMAQRRQFEAYAKAKYGNLNGPASLKNQVANGTFVFSSKSSGGVSVSAPQYYPTSAFPTVFLPLWQLSPLAPNAKVLMLDVHGDNTVATDHVLKTKNLAVGEPFTLVQDAGTSAGPSTIVYAPLVDANNDVFGVIAVLFTWSHVLDNIISTTYKRVYVVLKTKTTVSTFALDGGVASFLGRGDLHETAFDSYGTTLVLDPTNLVLSTFGYTVTVYPSQQLYSQYITNKPAVTCAVSVITILFTAAVFSLYRFFMERRERVLVEKVKLWALAVATRDAEEAARTHALDREKVMADKEREAALNAALQETIASSVHDLKSPVCALSLAVDSALQSLANPSEKHRKAAEETLHGMAHTLSTVSMIINRYSDAAKTSTGGALVPNVVPTDLRKVTAHAHASP